MTKPFYVKDQRIAKGMSRQELAEAAGVTRQAIHYIEVGHSVPKIVTAQRIAKALGTTIDRLWPEEE